MTLWSVICYANLLIGRISIQFICTVYADEDNHGLVLPFLESHRLTVLGQAVRRLSA